MKVKYNWSPPHDDAHKEGDRRGKEGEDDKRGPLQEVDDLGEEQDERKEGVACRGG